MGEVGRKASVEMGLELGISPYQEDTRVSEVREMNWIASPCIHIWHCAEKNVSVKCVNKCVIGSCLLLIFHQMLLLNFLLVCMLLPVRGFCG